MTPRSVVVASTVPDRLNTNWKLREYVAEGFGEALGADAVFPVAAERACAEVALRKPDLVLAFGGVMPDCVDLAPLRRAATRANAHFAVWLHDDPYELDYAFRVESLAETIFTNDRGSVVYYRHPSVHHLPLAGSPRAHAAAAAAGFAHDLMFCGVGFPNRVRFFEDIADDLSAFRVSIFGAEWPSTLWFAQNRRIDNGELVSLYASSAATLNLGRQFDLGNDRYQLAQSTPGPRTFEAAMAGCAQLYFVNGLEITEYFEPEREILLIDHARQVPLVLRRLIDDPSCLSALRCATRERALRDHTYARRAQHLLACISRS